MTLLDIAPFSPYHTIWRQLAPAFQTGEQSTTDLDAISTVGSLEPSESSAEGKFESLFSHRLEATNEYLPCRNNGPRTFRIRIQKAGSRSDNQLTTKLWRIDETKPSQRVRRRVYQTLGRGRGIDDRRHVSSCLTATGASFSPSGSYCYSWIQAPKPSP